MYNVPTIYIILLSHCYSYMVRCLYSEQSVLFKKNYLNCKSRNGSEKNPNKVKLVYIQVNVVHL